MNIHSNTHVKHTRFEYVLNVCSTFLRSIFPAIKGNPYLHVNKMNELIFLLT